MAEAFVGLTGFRRVVVDIIIYDDNELQHATHVRLFLQRCVEKRIALNPDKRKFSQTKVTFAGFTLSADGNQVDHSITDAITQFPTPTNRTALRSFFSLVNQLSCSTNAIASLLTPLRQLLSTKNDFLWSPDHQQAFVVIKDALTIAPVLSYFDIDKPTRLCTDASHHGLGFILQNTSGTWNLVHDSSPTLKPATQWLNLKCFSYAEKYISVSYFSQDYNTSPSLRTTIL